MDTPGETNEIRFSGSASAFLSGNRLPRDQVTMQLQKLVFRNKYLAISIRNAVGESGITLTRAGGKMKVIPVAGQRRPHNSMSLLGRKKG